MSYDIELVDPVTRKVVALPEKLHAKGGTYVLGGTTEASFNITYNYSPHFYRVFPEDGIRWLYGKVARETIPQLVSAIDQLGDDRDPDYWKATEGNAKEALSVLLHLARTCPDAIWDGD